MKFIANLKGYKKYFDMEAVIRNKKGTLLDSVTIEEAKKRYYNIGGRYKQFCGILIYYHNQHTHIFTPSTWTKR